MRNLSLKICLGLVQYHHLNLVSLLNWWYWTRSEQIFNDKLASNKWNFLQRKKERHLKIANTMLCWLYGRIKKNLNRFLNDEYEKQRQLTFVHISAFGSKSSILIKFTSREDSKYPRFAFKSNFANGFSCNNLRFMANPAMSIG